MKPKIIIAGFILLAALGTPVLFSQEESASGSGESLATLLTLEGERSNQLMGLGLVTGLSGRGDSPQNPALQQGLSRLMNHFGISVPREEIQSKNCALVSLTLEVPPYIRPGQTLDVRLSALGDASSLGGGVLLQAPLKGADGAVYAVAQGQIPYREDRDAAVVWIPSGTLVEKALISTPLEGNSIAFILKDPHYWRPWLAAQALQEEWPESEVTVDDPSHITMVKPDDLSVAELMDGLWDLQIETLDTPRVIVDSRSGVVVMGQGVKILPVALSCRGVKIEISSQEYNSFGGSESEAFPLSSASTVADLVSTLQELSLDTDTVIDILQAVDAAGALYGELVIR